MPETRSWAHLVQPKFSPFPSANVTQTSANRDGESPADARQGAPLPPFEFCQQRLLKPSYTCLEKCLQLRLMWKEKPSLLENDLCRWDLTWERSSMHSGALCVVRNNTRFLNCLWFIYFFFEKSWIVWRLYWFTTLRSWTIVLHFYISMVDIDTNIVGKLWYSVTVVTLSSFIPWKVKHQSEPWYLVFFLWEARRGGWGWISTPFIQLGICSNIC